jgi:NADH-quinone oxidoreductase subunit H
VFCFLLIFIIIIKLIIINLIKIILIIEIIRCLVLILPLLFAIAFFTVLERKILASMQRRRGPNYVGLFGSLQAIADAVKLLSKETIIPSNVNKYLFIFVPLITFVLSFLM